MKKIISLLILILLSISLVSAESMVVDIGSKLYGGSASSDIQIRQLKYEPYPVNPGEYFSLWIKVENIGGLTKNAVFELNPKYPFSLDTNEDAVRDFGQLSSVPVILEYKIRVDKDAVEGVNPIELKYSTDSNSENWIYHTFEIQVEDAQTDFDIVIQESSDDTMSIAIANIGKNVANSVIVKVPEQDNFKTIGSSGQMVGNLENGDYTLVSFQIQKKALAKDNILEFQIDYTDNIGERRSIIKQLNFETGEVISPIQTNAKTQVTEETSFYQTWWFWVVVIIVIVFGWKWNKKVNKKRK